MSDDVRNLIGALETGDMAQANNVFNNTIAARMQDALDARKVAVASEIYGSEAEIEADDTDLDLDDDADVELEDDIEQEDEDPVEYDLEDEDSEEED